MWNSNLVDQKWDREFTATFSVPEKLDIILILPTN